jgi:hypothetical protein
MYFQQTDDGFKIVYAKKDKATIKPGAIVVPSSSGSAAEYPAITTSRVNLDVTHSSYPVAMPPQSNLPPFYPPYPNGYPYGMPPPFYYPPEQMIKHHYHSHHHVGDARFCESDSSDSDCCCRHRNRCKRKHVKKPVLRKYLKEEMISGRQFVPMPIRREESTNFHKRQIVPMRASLRDLPSQRSNIVKPTLNYDNRGNKDISMSGDWYNDANGRMHYYDEDLI